MSGVSSVCYDPTQMKQKRLTNDQQQLNKQERTCELQTCMLYVKFVPGFCCVAHQVRSNHRFIRPTQRSQTRCRKLAKKHGEHRQIQKL